MSEPINQKISQFLDDDLNQSESLHLLTAMQQQPHLQATMQRYLLINQALKSKSIVVADVDFVAQIAQQLEQEPVYLLPKRRREARNYKPVFLALAASISAMAIIVPITLKMNARHNVNPVALAQLQSEFSVDSPETIPTSGGYELPEPAQPMRLYPVNKRFQDYLQAHNSSLYTNDPANFQTRAQLASYGQGQ
ncbi:MAG: sigma-E factor negative regulatory protein [Methylococcaceae bacterium]|nr:sigma-E factor negative regulatory protein [Methylococcaceae bacterium]